jgi:hypothetical protein
MHPSQKDPDEEKLLDDWQYRDLERKLSDMHNELSSLGFKIRAARKHDYEFERQVSNTVMALDQLKKTLDKKFRGY